MAVATKTKRTLKPALDLNTLLKSEFGQVPPPVVLKPVKMDGKELPFARAVVNKETGEPMSLVGAGYELVQHREILSQVGQAIKKLGLEKEGSLTRGLYFTRRGSRMRALFTFKTITKPVAPKDIFSPIVRVGNSYDGSMRVIIEIGAYRYSCTNMAVGGNGVFARGFSAIHSGEIKLDTIKTDLEEYLSKFDGIVELYKRWMDTPWGPGDVKKAKEMVGKRREEIVPVKAAHRYEAYNRLTDYGTHQMKSAPAAFDFLGRVNRLFQAL